MLNRMFFAQNVSREVVIPPKSNGRLYNWYAASANIAPSGWHVPTNAEFLALNSFLGSNSGGKLKEVGFTHWDSPNTGATDLYGFSALGAGFRIEGFTGILQAVDFWMRDINRQYILQYNSGSNVIGPNPRTYGASIRLLKDDSVNPGYFTDYDNNVYGTVTIGTQVWASQSLKVTHYNDGTPIPNVTDNATWAALTTGAMCAYNNDENNV